MSFRPRFTPLATGVALMLCLACAGAAGAAGLLPAAEKADLITTGNNSELIDSVPIATAPGLKERVAMTLGPEELPRFRAGDRLRIGAEVQLSTTCVEEGPRCVGRHYDLNPRVYTRIVLAGEPSAGATSIGLSPTREVRCNQRRPNRNHHCTIALPNTETVISDLASLPCAANECFVNVIVGAYHRRARPGHRVVLGADRPDASVIQDKGRLNVIHARAEVPAPTEASSNVLINPDLPLTEAKKVKRRVVFTLELPPAKKGEVLAIDGSFRSSIRHLPFNTFISSRLIVAETPTATESTGLARRATILRGDASEGNGFNCTQGPSGYRTPCTTEKSGAIRITRDVVDEAGSPAPLYVNLVASAKALLTERVKSTQRVQLTALGGLRLLRFAP
jgi:hypothetical protein